MNKSNNLMEKIAAFLKGRNGMDNIAKDAYVLSVVLLVLNLFFRSPFLHFLALVFVGYSLFRFLSRNINKRALENRNYMVYRNRVMNSFRFLKRKWDDRKMYRYYVCPECGQKVRVPAGKGKIEITCPKCGAHFTKRS